MLRDCWPNLVTAADWIWNTVKCYVPPRRPVGIVSLKSQACCLTECSKSERTFGDGGASGSNSEESWNRWGETGRIRLIWLFIDGPRGPGWLFLDLEIGTQQAALRWALEVMLAPALWNEAGVVHASCLVPCWLPDWWSEWSDWHPLVSALAESWVSVDGMKIPFWPPVSQHLLLQKTECQVGMSKSCKCLR